MDLPKTVKDCIDANQSQLNYVSSAPKHICQLLWIISSLPGRFGLHTTESIPLVINSYSLIGTKLGAMKVSDMQCYLGRCDKSVSENYFESIIISIEDYLVQVLLSGSTHKTLDDLHYWDYHHNKHMTIDKLHFCKGTYSLGIFGCLQHIIILHEH